MMFWYGNHMGMAAYAFMGVANLVFWGLVIVAGIVVFRTLAGRPAGHPGPAPGPAVHGDVSPEQVLAGRFARGEIDADEYHRRLAVLREAYSRSAGD